MKIKYWSNFSKRRNSTKQPTGGTEVDVYLKEDTSIINPVFDCATIPMSANYVYCGDFGRYYFVRDITRVSKDRVWLTCEVDALASYKTAIGSTSALVEYTSSSDEIKITDPRNKPLLDFSEVSKSLIDLGSYGFSTSGCFVVAIAGGAGGITYYVMSAASLEDFYDHVLSESFWTNLQNNIVHLDSAVLSCRWLPYTPAGTLVNNIKIMGQPTYADGYQITSRLATIIEDSYDIDFYSDSLGLGTNYLDFEPFTTGILYLPYVGCVPLDLGVCAKSKQIRIKIAIDNYTGDILYKISNEAGDIISTYQGNCSINIPLSSTSYNAAGAIGSGISLIGGLVSTAAAIATKGASGAVSAGLATTAAGAAGLAQSLSVHTQVNGSVSSAVATELSRKVIATVITRLPTETNLKAYKTILGMPYFKVATISSLSGYVQCSDASVGMGGTPGEKDIVNGYVNGGFYYE